MNLKIVLLVMLVPLFANSSKGNAVILQAVSVGRNSGYFVSSKNYDDLRVLDNAGRIKYWLVRSNNLQVEQYFDDGKIKEFRALEFSDLSTKELTYFNIKNTLTLVKAISRKKRLMAGIISGVKNSDLMCAQAKSLTEELGKVAKDISNEKCEENVQSKLIAPNCKKVFKSDEYQKLVDAYTANLVLPEDVNPMLKCLTQSSTVDVFAKSCNIKNSAELQTEFAVVSLRYKLNAAKVSQAPELVESKVKCDDSKKDAISALTDEKGITTFYNSNGNKPVASDEMEKLVFDELLHGAGIQDQKVVTNLINVCFSKATKIDCDFAKAVKYEVDNRNIADKGRRLLQDADRANDVAGKAASETNAKITTKDLSASVPQTLAKVEGPTPQAVAQEAVASSRAYVSNTSMTGETSEGQKQAILRSSLAMTQGPLNTAAKVMKLAGASLSTANAATTTSPKVVEAPTFDRGATSQRVPASVRGSSDESLSLKQTGSLSASADSGNSGGNAGSAGARSPASELGVSRGDAGTSSGGAVARSGSRGAVGGSASSGYASASSGSNNKRSPANASRISEEQQKLARMIEQAAYDRVQSQLAKKEFVRMLEQNNITILKLDGTPPVGATKGDIIYIDRATEGKFVRQK